MSNFVMVQYVLLVWKCILLLQKLQENVVKSVAKLFLVSSSWTQQISMLYAGSNNADASHKSILDPGVEAASVFMV